MQEKNLLKYAHFVEFTYEKAVLPDFEADTGKTFL